MDDTIRSQYRLPQSLHDALKRAAVGNRRSMNAELIARLESSFSDVDLGTVATARLQDQLEKLTLSQLMTTEEIETLIRRVAEYSAEQSSKGRRKT